MLGGSEEMVVETAIRLSKRYKVTVFHNGKHGVYDGVEYKDHRDFTIGGITINVNYPQFPSGGIYWTTLDKNPDLSQFKAVCVISKYAKMYTSVVHDSIHIVPPGYDPEQIYPGKKIANQCFYGSSPDRGLDILLEAWPEIYKAHPDATLLLTYGAKDIELSPGIINLGLVDKQTMNEIYQTSQYWLYPCTGTELYCMTGVKAQVTRCWPVIIPHMALKETVKYGTFTTADKFAEDVIETLKYGHFPHSFKYPTWDDVVNKLEKIIDIVYNGSI